MVHNHHHQLALAQNMNRAENYGNNSSKRKNFYSIFLFNNYHFKVHFDLTYLIYPRCLNCYYCSLSLHINFMANILLVEVSPLQLEHILEDLRSTDYLQQLPQQLTFFSRCSLVLHQMDHSRTLVLHQFHR